MPIIYAGGSFCEPVLHVTPGVTSDFTAPNSLMLAARDAYGLAVRVDFLSLASFIITPGDFRSESMTRFCESSWFLTESEGTEFMDFSVAGERHSGLRSFSWDFDEHISVVVTCETLEIREFRFRSTAKPSYLQRNEFLFAALELGKPTLQTRTCGGK